jgi:hypothetical protein
MAGQSVAVRTRESKIFGQTPRYCSSLEKTNKSNNLLISDRVPSIITKYTHAHTHTYLDGAFLNLFLNKFTHNVSIDAF